MFLELLHLRIKAPRQSVQQTHPFSSKIIDYMLILCFQWDERFLKQKCWTTELLEHDQHAIRGQSFAWITAATLRWVEAISRQNRVWFCEFWVSICCKPSSSSQFNEWRKRQHIEKWSLIAVCYPLHDLLYLKKKPTLIEHEKGDRIRAPWSGEPSVSFSKSWAEFLFLLKCNVKIMLESHRSWFQGEKQPAFLKVAEIYRPFKN